MLRSCCLLPIFSPSLFFSLFSLMSVFSYLLRRLNPPPVAASVAALHPQLATRFIVVTRFLKLSPTPSWPLDLQPSALSLLGSRGGGGGESYGSSKGMGGKE